MQASGQNYNFYNRVAGVIAYPIKGAQIFSQKAIISLFGIRNNFRRMWRR